MRILHHGTNIWRNPAKFCKSLNKYNLSAVLTKAANEYVQEVEHQTEELDRLKHLQERDSHEVEIFRERQAQERLVSNGILQICTAAD